MLVGGVRPQMITAVDLTIDELLVIADRLGVTAEFPTCLGIHCNIFDDAVRGRVWAAVRKSLTAQEILDASGSVHPAVGSMFTMSTRADTWIEGRWFHTVGGRMIRFAICRHGEDFLIVARSGHGGHRVILQRVAARVGLAGMVEAVVGQVAPAPMTTPVMGPVEHIRHATTTEDLTRYGADSRSASVLLEATSTPSSWVEFTAAERLPGGTIEYTTCGAGMLDSNTGRVVSIPRDVNGTVYGSFAAGTHANLERALRELTAFLPSGVWEFR